MAKKGIEIPVGRTITRAEQTAVANAMLYPQHWGISPELYWKVMKMVYDHESSAEWRKHYFPNGLPTKIGG